MAVVGEARDGLSAVSVATTLKPDVVVMDVSMPRSNGIEAAAEILKYHPTCRIVFLSVHTGPAFVLRALRAGASGYVLKDSAAHDILDAIRAVGAGRRYFSPDVAQALRESEGPGEGLIARPDPLEQLSLRERQVLQLVTEGMTNHQAAELLNISVKTVETYRSRVMSKLGIEDYPHLVLFAVREGILSLDTEVK